MSFAVHPGSVSGTVEVPGSKSIAQRVIAAASLATGDTLVHGAGDSSDVNAALRLASGLGATVESGPVIRITGKGIHPMSVVDAGESGLSSRMFIPLYGLADSDVEIRGERSLLSRPFQVFQDILPQAGVLFSSQAGKLPVHVRGPLRAGNYTMDGSVSSQFITGMLMALPLCEGDSTLMVSDPVSIPYLQCTLDVMSRFNVFVEHHAYSEFHISGNQRYVPGEWKIPGDWSSVATMLVAGIIAGEGELLVPVPDLTIAQADAFVLSVLKRAGIRIERRASYFVVKRTTPTAFETDLMHCPDLFPVLSVLAAVADGTSVLHGTSRLVSKESDRGKAIINMLRACGVPCREEGDALVITGGNPIQFGELTGSGDHRMIMAATLLGLAGNGCIIDEVNSVAKSFPGFFRELGLS